MMEKQKTKTIMAKYYKTRKEISLSKKEKKNNESNS